MPPPTITTPLAVVPAMLDHAVGAPALDDVTRVAQETRENLVVVLAGHGREPADAAGRLRQLERCPGGGQGTEDGMVELHEHLARLHLRIRDHLGHVVDPRGGDAGRREDAHHLRLGARAGPRLDDGGDLVAAVAPGRRGGEPGVARQLVAVDDRAEARPDRVARRGGDGHVAVGGRIDPGGGARERDVAGAGEDLAAHRVALAEVVERPHQAVQQVQVDAPAPAGVLRSRVTPSLLRSRYCAAGTRSSTPSRRRFTPSDTRSRPRSGDSTLITRAPMSASSIVQKGIARTWPRSSTVTSSSA